MLYMYFNMDIGGIAYTHPSPLQRVAPVSLRG
jgi:hypothetical protein